ncbi:S-layer homology domain-containing protein [Coleofasciculus sp. FACHB-64]|uniref:S-layer homology domain-containing protein n=1 Tax=Cyanophyceae TaxID=3028117 RepID=UPI0016826561|nr:MULTISPECIES: S-layer homology domain-containing protein [unclassified Coleofasciculus]MBD1839444.1 S-layer homology domain-containing protein [Coleofasciculus sp. FACHB-501]MBD1879242.1 S-layer homology domain-containing protein [Coleofasciculus sp. FACHB-T130]MBD1895971.1 S-layer homology domain-containing protein [Coleofasciculus sp. FACHB-129]MBD1902204.1 S-layer homology domain-containing protein [Coleofasciculus sp. FACHB-125]MBD1945072.1 S-layer homology domain-containing protein [Co
MSNLKRLKSGTALLLMLGMSAGSMAPLVETIMSPAPAVAQAINFSDVSSSYWAASFIQELAQRDVIAGFPDGTFRPNDPVTRAQFAAMVRKAFNKNKIRNAVNFVDLSSTYWAYSAIREAYEMGFLSGYPGNVFRPTQNIPREQVLVSLANGLNYTASNPVSADLQVYNDASSISTYARSSIAAATEKSIVVNYPTLQTLNPTRNATRAEVAAFIYQALVSSGQVAAINSPYIVSLNDTPPEDTTVAIPAGTTIPVRYEKEKILVTKDERAPLTLTVAANITTSDGTVLIPSGSQVVGELQPAQGGSQFVAKELVFTNGQRVAIDATSQTITKTESVTKGTSVGGILKNAALGAAAAAAVSAVTGDKAIATEEVLGGLGIGGLIGLFLGRDRVDLIAIDPDTDLNLRLNDELVLEQ